MTEDVSLVPSWELSAKIFITNLVSGTNPVAMESSKEAILAMARALDKIENRMTQLKKVEINRD